VNCTKITRDRPTSGQSAYECDHIVFKVIVEYLGLFLSNGVIVLWMYLLCLFVVYCYTTLRKLFIQRNLAD